MTDISPLYELPRLCEVWLYETAVSKEQAARVAEIIESRDFEPLTNATRMVYGP